LITHGAPNDHRVWVQIEAAEASTDPQGIAHAQSKVVLSVLPIICFPPKFSGTDPILMLD
jgi:hypothetical protein